ncbi:MAG: hypothetical protein HYR72_19740 [Deltaproteobacteria bacterium]|nr:hypothetical protein [Deltaproteobacteria bacterium]MBI3387337.1 hypothetical protein [Deltaproteobacteria bacterium]
MKDIDSEIRSKRALITRLEEEVAVLERARLLLVDAHAADPINAPGPRRQRKKWTHPRAGKVGPKSLMGRAIGVLREAGTPMHAKKIAEQIESQGMSVNLASLVGGLARMAKDGRFVCRDAKPNTFALLKGKPMS